MAGRTPPPRRPVLRMRPSAPGKEGREVLVRGAAPVAASAAAAGREAEGGREEAEDGGGRGGGAAGLVLE